MCGIYEFFNCDHQLGDKWLGGALGYYVGECLLSDASAVNRFL
jgi:hypothetical protein